MFKAIIQKDFLKVRVCVIAFQDIVINSAVFQVQTVSVSSYGECKSDPLKKRTELNFERAEVNTVKP